jgi:hypothetical protein
VRKLISTEQSGKIIRFLEHKIVLLPGFPEPLPEVSTYRRCGFSSSWYLIERSTVKMVGAFTSLQQRTIAKTAAVRENAKLGVWPKGRKRTTDDLSRPKLVR